MTQTGGTIHLGGTLTVVDLGLHEGRFSGSGGTVSIFGTLQNVNDAGQTLTGQDVTLTIDSLRQWQVSGGTIRGVTINGGGDPLKAGDTIRDTESGLDLEELVSQYVHGKVN